jgi:methylmalonyl-CoA/ethylmalonyl-CoA epimerase
MLPALRRGARGARRRRTAALPTPPTRRLSTPSFQLGRLNHVALAVPDLAAATKTWAALGATVSPPKAMPAHGVTACFVGEQLELLEPLGAESPIAAFLARHLAGGLHHVCHEVSDVAAAARDLESRGFRILAPPSIGAHGVPVVFLHPKETHGTLVELQGASGDKKCAL